MSPDAEPHGPRPGRVLLHSFSALAAGETAARVLGFVAIILMARRLTPVGFGVVAFATALLSWFRIVADSGTEFLAVRDVARTPDRFRAIAEPILGLRLTLSLAAGAVFAAGALLFPAEATDRQAMMLYALVLPLVALNLRWMVLGVQKARAVAIGNIASQVMMVCGVFLLVHSPEDVVIVPLVQASGELVYAALVLIAIGRRFGFIRPHVNLAVWRDVIRSGMPLCVNNLARAALYNFDVFLIALVLYRTDVGLYAAAYKPVLFGSTLVGLLQVSFLAAYSAPGAAGVRMALIHRTVAMAGGVAALGALVLSVGAATFLTVVLGDEYEGAAGALAILAWTLPVLAVTSPYASALIAADRQALFMRNNLIAAGFNITANFAAVPLAGIEGAASVTLTSFVIVFALSYRDAIRLGLAQPLGRLRMPREREVLPVVAATSSDRES